MHYVQVITFEECNKKPNIVCFKVGFELYCWQDAFWGSGRESRFADRLSASSEAVIWSRAVSWSAPAPSSSWRPSSWQLPTSPSDVFRLHHRGVTEDVPVISHSKECLRLSEDPHASAITKLGPWALPRRIQGSLWPSSSCADYNFGSMK